MAKKKGGKKRKESKKKKNYSTPARATKKEKKKAKKAKKKAGISWKGEMVASGAANVGVIVVTWIASGVQGLVERSGLLQKVGEFFGVSPERQLEAGKYAQAALLTTVQIVAGPKYGKYVAPSSRAALSSAAESTGRTIEALDATFAQVNPQFVPPSKPLGLPAPTTPATPKP